MSKPLKLAAKDEEGLATISSSLNDGIVPIVKMTFLDDERSFVFIVSRFGWGNAIEAAPEGKIYGCINCPVRIDGVGSVNQRKFDQARSLAILSSLAIQPGRGYIDFNFSGGGTIRLATGAVDG